MPKKLQDPGSFLKLLLEKYNLNPFKLSKDIKLSQSAVRLITIGKTKISVPVAMRLAKYFNIKPETWLTMQMNWDIAEASKNKALMNIVKGIAKAKKSAGGKAKSPAKKKTAKKKPAARKPAAKKKAAVRKTAAKKPVTKKRVVRKTTKARVKPAARRGRKPAKRK